MNIASFFCSELIMIGLALRRKRVPMDNRPSKRSVMDRCFRTKKKAFIRDRDALPRNDVVTEA